MADQQQQHRGNWRDRGPKEPPEKKIVIDVESFELKGNYWEFLLVAKITQGKRIVDQGSIQFFLDGTPIDSPKSIDAGRAEVGVEGVVSKDTRFFSVEAQVSGGESARAYKRIDLKAMGLMPEKKKVGPADLEIKAEGLNGVYQVNMQIIDSEGKGAKGTVRVITQKGKTDYETQEDGVAFDTIKIDRSQKIRFLVLGTKIDKELSWVGPSKVRPCCPTDLPNEVTSFLSGLIAGFKARRNAERRQS